LKKIENDPPHSIIIITIVVITVKIILGLRRLCGRADDSRLSPSTGSGSEHGCQTTL